MKDELIKHLEEYIQLIKTNNNKQLILTTTGESFILDTIELIEKAKHWKPEVFITIENGQIENVSANCNIVYNEFNLDIQKQMGDYEDQLSEWLYMLTSGIECKLLKQIYP